MFKGKFFHPALAEGCSRFIESIHYALKKGMHPELKLGRSIAIFILNIDI